MDTFLEFVKQYAAPSKAIHPDDLENLHKAAEIVREFTKQNGARFIERRKDKPILVQYGSDLTPLTHRHRLHEEAEGLSVTKNGKSSNEFLVQRCIITDLHGDACTVLEEPLILTRKTAWSHFCAERQLLKTPRELGHTGLAVSSHKFDGALQQTLKRLFRKWQQVYDDDQEEKLGRTKAYRLWIRNWYESETCAAHFLNGGLKWALMVMPYIDDPEVLKSAFIVRESCCNGHNLIQEFIGRWILAVMTFTSTAWPEAREFYSTWSLKEETLETAVDLEVRFQDGKLLVSEKHRERLGLIDLLVVFLLKVWMFARWTMSRWLSFGRGSRVQVLAYHLGLVQLVQFIIHNGGSKFYIGGVLRHGSKKVKHIAVLAGLSARVADEPLKLIFKDDRLPMQLEEIDRVLDAEVKRISDLSDAFWQRMEVITEMDLREIRSQTLGCSEAAAGYVKMNLRHARQGVWNYLAGDREAKLRELEAGPPPLGSGTVFKMYEMLRLEGAMGECLEGLALLAKAGWSTQDEESGHKITSALIQLHRQYGARTLQARALVSSFAPLLTLTKDEKRLIALNKKLQVRQNKKPNYFTGRQLFLQELNTEAAAQRIAGRGVPLDIADQIIHGHGDRWHAMRPQRREDYEARAADERKEKKQLLQAEMDSIREKRLQIEKKIEEDKQVQKPVRLAYVHLAKEEKLEIAACWTDPNFSKPKVMALEQDDGRILETPGDVVLRALESIQLYAADKTPARKPLWLPLLCWNRGDFASYILNIVDFATGAEGFYKTTFALQNPLIAGFIPLEEVLEPDALVADVGYQRAMLENHDHTFKYIAPLDFIFSDDDRLTTASGVQVLPHAKAIGNQTLVVNGDWRTFEGWVSRH